MLKRSLELTETTRIRKEKEFLKQRRQHQEQRRPNKQQRRNENVEKSSSPTGENKDFESSPSNNTVTDDGETYHVLFSTDCSPYQHWQSYVLFYHAHRVGQPGRVTRIASGCTETEAIELEKWHDEHVKTKMSTEYYLHLTPHYSSFKKEDGKKGKYDFFNKPMGMLHWLEHSEHMGVDSETDLPRFPDTITILIDPDMILRRPLTADFFEDDGVVWSRGNAADGPRRVARGAPFAQLYGIGAKWTTFDLVDVTGDPASPARSATRDDANAFFAVGPPYLATAADAYVIAKRWAEFVPRVHAQYPHLLAEMYAYSVAAAHVRLPHRVVSSLMVSDTNVATEGWDLLDRDLDLSSACVAGRTKGDDDRRPYPSVLHFCQRYLLGKSFFGKRRLPKNFLTCDFPLLAMAPDDVGEKHDYWIPPGDTKKKGSLSKKQRVRNAYMICAMTKAVNDAAIFFKRNSCRDVENTRFDESFNLWASK